MTLELDWLKRWALYSPTNVALQCGESGRTLNYHQLYQQSLCLADVLTECFRIESGDRVACVAQNELETISLFFACQRLGAILVPINFRFTTSEIEHIVNDSGAKLLIAQDPFTEVADRVQAQHALLRWNFAALCDAVNGATGGKVRDFCTQAEDPCMILYTSGTTGFPKGAMVSSRMLFWNSVNTGLRLNLTQGDVVVTFLPLFHTGGWNVLTTPCLHRGARVILLKKFNADVVLQLCARERVSVLFGVPTTMDLLARSSMFNSCDLSSVRYAIVGGEPMPLPGIQQWQKRGIPIRQGYGLTEFGPNVFSLNEEDCERKMGSIGFPNFYIEARVVDELGRDLTVDQVGELLLRGPVAMSGYWNNPRATREVMRDGWLHTGDLVRRDAEGFYYVVGRKKEMFISGGENVYPAEVEKVLRQYTGVVEAAVIGVCHAKWGESGRAFVAPEAGQHLTMEGLRDHCLRHLAKFKVPQEFVFLSELPKTASGKIAKQELLALRNFEFEPIQR